MASALNVSLGVVDELVSGMDADRWIAGEDAGISGYLRHGIRIRPPGFCPGFRQPGRERDRGRDLDRGVSVDRVYLPRALNGGRGHRHRVDAALHAPGRE